MEALFGGQAPGERTGQTPGSIPGPGRKGGRGGGSGASSATEDYFEHGADSNGRSAAKSGGKGKGKGKSKGKGKGQGQGQGSGPSQGGGQSTRDGRRTPGGKKQSNGGVVAGTDKRLRKKQDREFRQSSAYAESDWFASSPDPADLPPPVFPSEGGRGRTRAVRNQNGARGQQQHSAPASGRSGGNVRVRGSGSGSRRETPVSAALTPRSTETGASHSPGPMQPRNPATYTPVRGRGSKAASSTPVERASSAESDAGVTGTISIHGLEAAAPLQL